MSIPVCLCTLLLALGLCFGGRGEELRARKFHAETPREAVAWQAATRQKLFALMMGGKEPLRVPLDAKVLHRFEVPAQGYFLEEISLQSLPDRRAHAWLARPLQPNGPVGAVLALHGHGGSGEEVVRGKSLYWYGRELAQKGYVVIAPDIGQHERQHTDWSLMGERAWDALRCVDYVLTLPEVEPRDVAVAGLSLGGETTMYVAALDQRLKLACSSGWLSTIANLQNGHCPCYNFPGLAENFDFADIFSCIAPRLLVCELGTQERAPGGFPVEIGRGAFEEIRRAYVVFGAESNLSFTVHTGPHVFDGRDFWPHLTSMGDSGHEFAPNRTAAAAWIRFTDAPEALESIPYHWLGRTELQLTLDVVPEPGDVLALSWGSKADRREAVVAINNKSVSVEDGGHWGFRWLTLPVPAGVGGNRYRLQFLRGQGQAAFLSEVRLLRARPDAPPPDLRQPSYKAALQLWPIEAAATEAFPEMRKVWDFKAVLPSARKPLEANLFARAEANARLANEAFYRCRRYVDGWLAHADPDTGLIPRNLRESNYWNGRDSAADNYPFMVLTAAMTDRPLLEGRLSDMLRTETRLTCRLGRLPDDYAFAKKGWRREKLDLDEIIFDGAEYVKDGLLYVAEWLGPSPWTERMLGITDDIWRFAPVDTPYGRIPTLNFEVNGDLLQACSRVYWFTGQRKYLEWATRLGDYYLLGTNHPTRDLKQLRLIDHGCEVINGLTELYVAVAHAAPEKRSQYEKPLHELFDCILDQGRNADGLLYSWFNPQTGAHSQGLCDTWGYDFDGFYTLWLLDHTTAYRNAVRQALGNLQGKYVGACWDDKSADGFADSIEGALNLFNREAVPSAAPWIDSQTRLMWAIQKPDGIIEGWHGDGNFARTSLMYALWKTQGLTIEPWRADVRFGAVRDGGTLYVCVTVDRPWKGRLVFDRPRHKVLMHLPLDYTRINQFPEWFTAWPEARYQVKVGGQRARTLSGTQLISGLPVSLGGGETLLIQVDPAVGGL